MLIIDIDHFKSINDQHGHAEGDEALKLVAATLRADVHEPAFIGRLGGEEFVVVMPGADFDQAYRLAERFREGVMSHRYAPLADGPAHHGQHRLDDVEAVRAIRRARCCSGRTRRSTKRSARVATA